MNKLVFKVINCVADNPRMCVYIAGVTTIGISIGILGTSVGWVLFVYGMGAIFGAIGSYIAHAMDT